MSKWDATGARWKVGYAWDKFLQELADNDSYEPEEQKEYLKIIGSELGSDISDAYIDYLEESE